MKSDNDLQNEIQELKKQLRKQSYPLGWIIWISFCWTIGIFIGQLIMSQ